MAVDFRVAQAGTARVEVLSLTGARLWHTSVSLGAQGAGKVYWNGRVLAGVSLAPRTYLVRVAAPQSSLVLVLPQR